MNFHIFLSFPINSFKTIFYALQFFFFKSLRGHQNYFTLIIKTTSMQLMQSPFLSALMKTEGKHAQTPLVIMQPCLSSILFCWLKCPRNDFVSYSFYSERIFNFFYYLVKEHRRSSHMQNAENCPWWDDPVCSSSINQTQIPTWIFSQSFLKHLFSLFFFINLPLVPNSVNYLPNWQKKWNLISFSWASTFQVFY